MRNYYLAVDIGASSGRHILGWLEEGVIRLEEVYRFENGMREENGHLCWDIDNIYRELLEGLRRCRSINKFPKTMAIDTWAVDYVLLDGNGERIGSCYGYRDKRTDGMPEKLSGIISDKELYERSGIQKQSFNTIYQLMAGMEQEPRNMERAEHLLMLPDYLSFLLTGKYSSEYTNATSTQLVSPYSRDWDFELIKSLGLKKSLFKEMSMPGEKIGMLKAELSQELGFQTELIHAASHDTASAVMAVPALEKDFLYISSGTWSLMGVELTEALIKEEGRKLNLTNEGGYGRSFRYLKNIMGLWMIQSVRRELGNKESFSELCRLAEEHSDFPGRVDVNSPEFLAPESMIQAIRDYCIKSGQPAPEKKGELSALIYQSLAEGYAKAARELEGLCGRSYDSIYIVGGGSNAEYLNKLTAEKTGKTVYAGPGEATAIGNILSQLIRDNYFTDIKSAREAVCRSFKIKEYKAEIKGNTV